MQHNNFVWILKKECCGILFVHNLLKRREMKTFVYKFLIAVCSKFVAFFQRGSKSFYLNVESCEFFKN